MLDGTKLNVLENSRQLLRAFGGLNETYGCSEAQWASEINFSSRGYPALQTRKPRRCVRQTERMHGAYHLNGLLLCYGTTLEYTPDDGSQTVVLENALTDDRKELVGMGAKVLIWPDRKAFDTQTGQLTELGAKWELGQDDQVTLCPCDADGKTYTDFTTGETEPEKPKDGQLFLKGKNYDNTGVLEKYNASTGKWVQILLDRIKMVCPGLGGSVKAGDTLTIRYLPSVLMSEDNTLYVETELYDLNGECEVYSADGDTLILKKELGETHFYYGTWTLTSKKVSWTSADGKKKLSTALQEAKYLELERRVPELDFVTECDNRVWGCRKDENAIYACALGDPTNWYSYQGTAADSYTVAVGSDGPFTAAASCLGYVLFFKENCIHKLYGTKPSEYRLSSVRCRGVAQNAGHSLCVIAERLYYLSTDGVMAWDGSLPVKVSADLDTSRMQSVEWTAAGWMDTRYYLYLRQAGADAGRLLVYDTEKGLWHEESAAGQEMASTGRQLYLWDGSWLWAVDPDRETGTDSEEPDEVVQFEAVSGEIGLSLPDDKYVSRVTLRVDADGPGVVTLAASYDGGPFEKVSSCPARGSHDRMNLPFEPRRFDTMRLRVSGKGQVALRSLALTLAEASGGRVSGAVPR